MELGEKLKELNLTAYEVDRFTKAFKDEKFREMLRDYTQEISDPENRKMYEEGIKILEQERGNTVEFIHPEPFRAIKTSVDGKQKCFINICASDKVGKPSSKWVVSENGRRGQCWSLPHSLHPGRQDTDPKGNKMMIYDVVFHPDTTRMASKNKSFLEMVDSIAIQGIQGTFKVTLDKKNMREMKTKYKGTPQPCVIRKAIPGFKAKESSDPPDPLAPRTTKNSTDSKPQSLLKTREPTKPNYTVKYRSLIDLQDFRCSRDSAQSPRPKEIVVTVDLPLLKSVKDTSLEVKEKQLLLETKKPAYRLELHLAYPVDEDKGEAKFNKQRGQLIVTLPVLPHNLPPDLFEGPAMANNKSASCDESEEDKSEVEEEDKQKNREGEKREQELQKGMEQDAAFQNQTSSDEARKTAMDECDTSERVVKSKDTHPTRNVKTSSGGESGQRVTFCSEDVTVGSAKQEMDEDDLQTEQISPVLQRNKPPPVLLREIDKDGNEIVISDHTSSAGFTFLNTLMYELD
uniref:Protein kintoun n=1 Tax=Astatotilapia calliptera TaxID=8154 RepID=A0AAX7USV6_ASTCA